MLPEHKARECSFPHAIAVTSWLMEIFSTRLKEGVTKELYTLWKEITKSLRNSKYRIKAGCKKES